MTKSPLGSGIGRKRPANRNARNQPAKRPATRNARNQPSPRVQLPNNISRNIQGRLDNPIDQYRMWRAMPLAVPRPKSDYLIGTGKHQKWWNEGWKKIDSLLKLFDEIKIGTWRDKDALRGAWFLFIKFKEWLPRNEVVKRMLERQVRPREQMYPFAWERATRDAPLPSTSNGIIDVFLEKSKALYDQQLDKIGLLRPNFSQYMPAWRKAKKQGRKRYRWSDLTGERYERQLDRHFDKLDRRAQRRTEAAAATLIKRAYRRWKKQR